MFTGHFPQKSPIISGFFVVHTTDLLLPWSLCHGWRRPIEYLTFTGHFPQKSPVIRALLQNIQQISSSHEAFVMGAICVCLYIYIYIYTQIYVYIYIYIRLTHRCSGCCATWQGSLVWFEVDLSARPALFRMSSIKINDTQITSHL